MEKTAGMQTGCPGSPEPQLRDLGRRVHTDYLCFRSEGWNPKLASSWKALGTLLVMSVYVRVSVPGCPSFLGVTRHPASRLSQPLFKKFTQTRWATPVETLEEIIATVGIRLPEFSELKDCFQEVRELRSGPGHWRCLDAPANQQCLYLAPTCVYTRVFTCARGMQAPVLTLLPLRIPGLLPWKL